MDSATELIWHNQVPLKVSVFVWSLIRNRLPTKLNLVSRSVIYSRLCVSGCGHVEIAHNLLLSRSTFATLCPLVRDWIILAIRG